MADSDFAATGTIQPRMNRITMTSQSVAAETAANSVGYYSLAHEICVRVNDDKTQLTDDERIVLSMVAAQAALARYIEPGDRNAEETLNKILRVLDHKELNEAMSRKMAQLLEQSEHRHRVPGLAEKLNYL
jgi:hypothetical protein